MIRAVPSRPTAHSGIALLSALLLAAIASAIAVALVSRQHLEITLVTRLRDAARSERLVRDAEAAGVEVLSEDASQNQHDSLDELWATEGVAVETQDGSVRGTLADVQSLFNLNNLSAKLQALKGQPGPAAAPPTTGAPTPAPAAGDAPPAPASDPTAPASAGAGDSGTAAAATDTPAGLVLREVTLSSSGGTRRTLPVLMRADEQGEAPPADTARTVQQALAAQVLVDAAGTELGATTETPAAPTPGAATPATGGTPRVQVRPDAIAIARFKLLLKGLDIQDPIVPALLDWLDEDSDVRFPNGAEDDYYTRLPTPYRAANRPLADVSELRLIKGVTPEIYAKLAPYVVAWPKILPINVNTAPVEVLMSISPGLDRTAAEAIVHQRDAQPFASLQSFTASPPVIGRLVLTEGLAVASGLFALQTRIDIDGVTQYARSVLARNGPFHLQVVRRKRVLGDG